MKKFLTMTIASVTSMIGWWLGSFVGIFTALIVSMIFAGFGMYFGNRMLQGM
jgi:hypothetical protein